MNLIKIPDGVQLLRISAVAITDTYKGLEKELIEDIDLCFEKEEIREFGFKNEKWQYPYDLIIYLDGIKEDIFIYQCTFPQEELSYALGYRARTFLCGKQIKSKYVKRLEKFATGYKWMLTIIAFIICLISIILFPDGVEKYREAVENCSGTNSASAQCALCFMGVMFFIFTLSDVTKEEGILQESKLKSEYYLDSDGNWSSSEK